MRSILLREILKLLRTQWGAQLALLALLLWLTLSLLLLFRTPHYYSDDNYRSTDYLSWSYWTDHVLRTPTTLANSSRLRLAADRSGNRLWMLTDQGILNSTNGGASWNWQFRPLDAGFNGVDLLDIVLREDQGASILGEQANLLGTDRILWVLAGNGHVLASTNDGLAWKDTPGCTEPQPDTFSAPLRQPNALYFSDREHGWVVGDRGLICATEDGGKSWTLQEVDGLTENLNAVHFASPQHGWIVGNGGTLLATVDGKKWTKQELPLTSAFPDDYVLARKAPPALYAVRFQNNDVGWAAGEWGTLLATRNGGRTWTLMADAMKAANRETVRHLAIRQDSAGSPVLWAAGNHVLLSSEAGKPVRQPVYELASGSKYIGHVVIGEKGRSWLALAGGRPTLSTAWDGDENRQRTLMPKPYALSPAYGFTTLACAILFLLGIWRGSRSLQAVRIENTDPILSVFYSDRPQQGGDADALGTRPLAWGISRFLRHRATEPPLTLAITAPWGCGKSSMMNWLKEDLERFGYHTLWLNAWHYEKQEQMFPALMERVRSCALPHWLSWEGVLFRLKLIKDRVWKNPGWSLSCLVIFAFATGYYYQHVSTINEQVGYRLTCLMEEAFHKQPPSAREAWLKKSVCDEMADAAMKSGKKETKDKNKSEAGSALWDYWQLLLGGPLIGLWRGARAFQTPDSALSKLTHNSEEGRSRRETAVKEQFELDFSSVTNALPRPLVIFIDDLDRCQPRSVCEVLDVVNLLSTGKCHVVFGMWKERVEQAVGLGFADTSLEHALLSTGPKPDLASDEGKAQARRQYGSLHLEKLVNLWVEVPDMTPQATADLLVTEPNGAELVPAFPLRRYQDFFLRTFAAGWQRLRVWIGQKRDNTRCLLHPRSWDREAWVSILKWTLHWGWYLLRWPLARLFWLVCTSFFAGALILMMALAMDLADFRSRLEKNLLDSMALSSLIQIVRYCFWPSRLPSVAFLEVLPPWLRWSSLRERFGKDNRTWKACGATLLSAGHHSSRFVVRQSVILAFCLLIIVNAPASLSINKFGMGLGIVGLIYVLPTHPILIRLATLLRGALPTQAPSFRPLLTALKIGFIPCAIAWQSSHWGMEWPPEDIRSPYPRPAQMIEIKTETKHETRTEKVTGASTEMRSEIEVTTQSKALPDTQTPAASQGESQQSTVVFDSQLPARDTSNPVLPSHPAPESIPSPDRLTAAVQQAISGVSMQSPKPVQPAPARSPKRRPKSETANIACRSPFPIPAWNESRAETPLPEVAPPPTSNTRSSRESDAPICRSSSPIPAWSPLGVAAEPPRETEDIATGEQRMGPIQLAVFDYLIPMILATATVLFFAVRFLRELLEVPDDSPTFKKSLAHWAPVLHARYRTPRRIKRFINDLRFTALTKSPSPTPDCTAWESLWTRYINPVAHDESANAMAAGAEARLLFEHVLEACCGEQAKNLLKPSGELAKDWKNWIKLDPKVLETLDKSDAAQLMAILQQHIDSYLASMTNGAPTATEIS